MRSSAGHAEAWIYGPQVLGIGHEEVDVLAEPVIEAEQSMSTVPPLRIPDAEAGEKAVGGPVMAGQGLPMWLTRPPRSRGQGPARCAPVAALGAALRRGGLGPCRQGRLCRPQEM